MTLDDLRAKYESAFEAAALEDDATLEVAERAGIRAVVTALRDEITAEPYYQAVTVLEGILASDGEEAAGGSTREDGRASDGACLLPLPEALQTPAADLVCVWEKSPLRLYEHSASILYRTGCGADFFYNHKQCQGCGKPISIKSEAAR